MWKCVQAILSYYIVYTLAFDEICVNGEESQEMTDKGRVQYQLLRERGNLPKYGNCWKLAVEHLEDGCRNLSEETQSDIALHITNCFLGMSGHETYNCELDKKPNLRGICISSMTDRAFNVYTEFYTHTQNMCWFLRGQIWQETMAENTLRVTKQLEESARNQENLLKTQQESLIIQEKMLEHGKFLGKVMEDLYLTAEIHKELLKGLQSWLIGEISWFNTVMFYISATILTLILTSTQRTCISRFPILFLLFLNCVFERVIYSVWVTYSSNIDASSLYNNINLCIWFCRYLFTIIALIILARQAYFYRDCVTENNKLLQTIYDQNSKIIGILYRSNIRQPDFSNEKHSTINEVNGFKADTYGVNHLNGQISDGSETNYKKSDSFVHTYKSKTVEVNENLGNGTDIQAYLGKNFQLYDSTAVKENQSIPKYNKVACRSKISPLNELNTSYNNRYNLRMRSTTPDSNK